LKAATRANSSTPCRSARGAKPRSCCTYAKFVKGLPISVRMASYIFISRGAPGNTQLSLASISGGRGYICNTVRHASLLRAGHRRITDAHRRRPLLSIFQVLRSVFFFFHACLNGGAAVCLRTRPVSQDSSYALGQNRIPHLSPTELLEKKMRRQLAALAAFRFCNPRMISRQPKIFGRTLS